MICVFRTGVMNQTSRTVYEGVSAVYTARGWHLAVKLRCCLCSVCRSLLMKNSSDKISLWRDKAHLLLVTFIYSFVYFFHLFLYFLKHKTVKTAVKERALVSLPVKSAMYPSESLFILLSVLLVSVLAIVLPISSVFEHLALRSTCQSLL